MMILLSPKEFSGLSLLRIRTTGGRGAIDEKWPIFIRHELT